MSLYWVLQGHTPVPTDDPLECEQMLQTDERIVGRTDVDSYRVSTVFLGIDHNWYPTGPPVLFETMVFGEGALMSDLWTARYCTWEEAEAGHEAVVYKLKNQLEEPA